MKLQKKQISTLKGEFHSNMWHEGQRFILPDCTLTRIFQTVAGDDRRGVVGAHGKDDGAPHVACLPHRVRGAVRATPTHVLLHALHQHYAGTNEDQSPQETGCVRISRFLNLSCESASGTRRSKRVT